MKTNKMPAKHRDIFRHTRIAKNIAKVTCRLGKQKKLSGYSTGSNPRPADWFRKLFVLHPNLGVGGKYEEQQVDDDCQDDKKEPRAWWCLVGFIFVFIGLAF